MLYFIYGNDFKLIDIHIKNFINGVEYERVDFDSKNDLIASLNSINLFKPSIINIVSIENYSEIEIEEILKNLSTSKNNIIFVAKISKKYRKKFNNYNFKFLELYIPDEKDLHTKLLEYSRLLNITLSTENLKLIKSVQASNYQEIQNKISLLKVFQHNISNLTQSETPPWKVVDVLHKKLSYKEVYFDLFPLIAYLQNRVKEAILLLDEDKPFPYNLTFLKKCDLKRLLEVLNLTIKYDYLIKKNSTFNLQNIFLKELELIINN
jgi:hypothetical protein